MGLLRIGKEPKSLRNYYNEGEKDHINKLGRIRARLMKRGHEESEDGQLSGYATAMEVAISAIFDDVPDLVEDALEVLANPPSTWDRYLAMHDGKHIYEMEFGELREAIKRDLKTGTSELHVHKEMTHVLAAAMYMALIDDK